MGGKIGGCRQTVLEVCTTPNTLDAKALTVPATGLVAPKIWCIFSKRGRVFSML